VGQGHRQLLKHAIPKMICSFCSIQEKINLKLVLKQFIQLTKLNSESEVLKKFQNHERN
jgi:hypothetical protein